MSELTVLLLPLIGALFFFLPGMSAVLAFSTRSSFWRGDHVHFITASAGLSISMTVLVMFLILLISRVSGMAFQFVAVPVVLAAVTGAFLLAAAVRGAPRTSGGMKGGEGTVPGGNDGEMH